MSLYLAIESSCDETSIALLQSKKTSNYQASLYEYINNFEVLGSIVSSQIKLHQQYGGVVPEIGARKHADQIHWIFQSLIKQIWGDEMSIGDLLHQLECIFVTTEPGLVSALRVGGEFAKTLAFYTKSLSGKDVTVKPINHLKGHVASAFFELKANQLSNDMNHNYSQRDLFPHLHLLVSGGNSQIILLNDWNDWKIIGKTLDDAAGESLDKIGRMLGLPYPGGVYVARIAGMEDTNFVDLPIGMSKRDSYDFSFSGLKTATRYLIQKDDVLTFEQPLNEEQITALLNPGMPDDLYLRSVKQLCISTQSVVVQQLINKFKLAVTQNNIVSMGLSGGVSANLLLRSHMQQLATNNNLPLLIPDLSLTGDNAVMIGLAGLLSLYPNNSGLVV